MNYLSTCPFKKHVCKQAGHKEDYCNVKDPTNKKINAETRVTRQVNCIAVDENREFITAEINGTFARLLIESASNVTIISRGT